MSKFARRSEGFLRRGLGPGLPEITASQDIGKVVGVGSDGLAAWVNPYDAPNLFLGKMDWYAEDWGHNESSSDEFLTTVNGAGASRTASERDSHTGSQLPTATHSTGTTNAGRVARFVRPGSGPLIANALWEYGYRTRFYIRAALSSAAEQFVDRIGFGDTLTGDHAEGAYVELDSQVDTEFQCKIAKAGVRSTTDSGLTAVFNTLYDLEIIINGVTDAKMYIQAAGAARTLRATMSGANFPTAGFAVGTNRIKSVGTTARLFGCIFQQAWRRKL